MKYLSVVEIINERVLRGGAYVPEYGRRLINMDSKIIDIQDGLPITDSSRFDTTGSPVTFDTVWIRIATNSTDKNVGEGQMVGIEQLRIEGSIQTLEAALIELGKDENTVIAVTGEVPELSHA